MIYVPVFGNDDRSVLSASFNNNTKCNYLVWFLEFYHPNLEKTEYLNVLVKQFFIFE